MVVEPHELLPPPPRRRRRRRPTLWDVREPQYGVPLPPPGASLSASPGPNASGTPGADAAARPHYAQNAPPHYGAPHHNAQHAHHHHAQSNSAMASAAPAAHHGLSARSALSPRDVVRAPRPGENGSLAGIDVRGLRALLSGNGAGGSRDARSSGGLGMDAGRGAAGGLSGEPGSGIAGMGGGVGGAGRGIGNGVMGGGSIGGPGVGMVNGMGADGATAGLGGMQTTRHARRLYVGNLPPETTDMQIGDFFNRALVAAHGSESGDEPVISVYINLDKRFAFIETRTVREAAAGLMLDGVRFRDMFLRVRRPNDFQPSALPGGGTSLRPPEAFDPTVLGIVSTQVSDGPNKMFVGGLPYTLTEEQIKSLLASYGQLAAFNLIKEPNSGMSKGFAFFEYVDGAVVDAACKGLHGMKVGDKTLTVRRATHSSGNNAVTFASGMARTNGGSAGAGAGMSAGPGGGGIGAAASSPTSAAASAAAASLPTPSGPIPASVLIRSVTRVVCLDDAVSPDELEDDSEHADIVEDVRDEARKLGPVEEVLVPRRVDGEELAAAVGKIFVRYAKTDDADRAQMVFAGRRFGERTVASSFFDEERFRSRKF